MAVDHQAGARHTHLNTPEFAGEVVTAFREAFAARAGRA